MATEGHQHGESHALDQENQQSLLPKPLASKFVRKACKGTTNLTKHLPSCSVLAFQLLSPISTNQGQCNNNINKHLTLGLLIICAIMCFVLSFTDSFRDAKGKVRYGVATWKGLWVIEGAKLPASEAAKYHITFIDLLHGLMSSFLFVAVSFFDQNVINCLFPKPSDTMEVIIVFVPLGVFAVCSTLFVVFPTKRHGISYPLSKN